MEVHRRNRRDFSGGDGLLKLSDNVHDFGILPSVHLGIILNDGVLAIYTLYEVQTPRQISGIHCTQGFSLRVRKCIVGSQGIIKGTVFLDVQRTPLLNILGNIKMVNEVFLFLLFGFSTGSDLCVCLFVRVVPIDTDALMLLLIVNGSTIVLEPIILHSSVHIALGSFFRFLQSVVVQFIIEAIFKVMVGGNQIAGSHALLVAVNHLRCQPFWFVGNHFIQLTHLGNLCMAVACPQMLFAVLSCTKEVFAVHTQTV